MPIGICLSRTPVACPSDSVPSASRTKGRTASHRTRGIPRYPVFQSSHPSRPPCVLESQNVLESLPGVGWKFMRENPSHCRVIPRTKKPQRRRLFPRFPAVSVCKFVHARDPSDPRGMKIALTHTEGADGLLCLWFLGFFPPPPRGPKKASYDALIS